MVQFQDSTTDLSAPRVSKLVLPFIVNSATARPSTLSQMCLYQCNSDQSCQFF
ncbi:hypothetical protein SEVIR_6G033495v4 [Setaria viridis]